MTVLGAVVVVIAPLLGVLVHRALASSSFSAALPLDVPHGETLPSVPGMASDQPTPKERLRHGDREDDGAVPEGVTVFDDAYPAVANLNPALLDALRRAATDAASQRVELFVESGWRSRGYQEQLFREAVSEFGSAKEAARWVATPDKSRHVSGDAVDVGHSDAKAWLSKFGAKYGLCQIYRNEPWHYELRPQAVNHRCPAMYADPSQDPRLQS